MRINHYVTTDLAIDLCQHVDQQAYFSMSLNVYIFEAMRLLFAVLYSNQLIAQKATNASFICIDRTGYYCGISLNIDLLKVIKRLCRKQFIYNTVKKMVQLIMLYCRNDIYKQSNEKEKFGLYVCRILFVMSAVSSLITTWTRFCPTVRQKLSK